MGFLDRFFATRWSLQLVQNEREVIYAMHEDSALRIVGYVMGYFEKGGRPNDDWGIYLKFNRKNKKIKLGQQHFTVDGRDITKILTQEIESIDPGNWKIRGSEPVFEEVSTKRRIKISEEGIDIQAMIENIGKPKELTFFSIMDEIFGKTSR